MSDAAGFLRRVVGALDASAVPYMLTGSFASSHHGAPRTTQDIDIVIDPTFDSLARLLDLLSSDAQTYVDSEVANAEFRRRSQFNVIDMNTGWKVDLIFRKARPFSRAELERRQPASVLGVDVYVSTPEDTILAKLEWAKLGESERQLRDVRGMLEVQGARIDRAYIERWLDELGVRDTWARL